MPVPAKAEPERIDVTNDEPLKAECTHFLHSMTNGNRPLTDGDEGLRVLRVLNAAQESLDNRGLGSEKLKDEGTKSQKVSCQLTNNKQQLTIGFIHDTAFIDQPAEIGQGIRIWHFSHVLKNSRIGENCNIGQNVVIGPAGNGWTTTGAALCAGGCWHKPA